jgi:Ca-activated chloride channel homolog
MSARQWVPRALVVLAGLVVVTGVLLAACEINPAERNNAGVALYSQGANDAALDAYQNAMVNAPNRPETYFNAASAFSTIGRLETAIAALEQALKTADEDLTAQAYYNLGNIYFDGAQYQNAVDAYRETLLRRPDDESARYNYELALSRLPTPTPPPPDESEQQQEQQESGQQPTPTPSPDPGGNEPEETGEPQSEGQSEIGQEAGTPTPQPEGPLTIEQAEQLLDAVQQNQEPLSNYQSRDVPQAITPEKDW